MDEEVIACGILLTISAAANGMLVSTQDYVGNDCSRTHTPHSTDKPITWINVALTKFNLKTQLISEFKGRGLDPVPHTII